MARTFYGPFVRIDVPDREDSLRDQCDCGELAWPVAVATEPSDAKVAVYLCPHCAARWLCWWALGDSLAG